MRPPALVEKNPRSFEFGSRHITHYIFLLDLGLQGKNLHFVFPPLPSHKKEREKKNYIKNKCGLSDLYSHFFLVFFSPARSLRL